MEIFDLSSFINVNQYLGFIYALVIGVLLGIDHEFKKKEKFHGNTPGIKSFLFMSLLGSLAAFLSLKVLESILFYFIFFVVIVLVLVVFLILNFLKTKSFSSTIEYSLIMTFILGSLCSFGYTEVAIVFTLMTTIISSLNQKATDVFKKLDAKEISSTIKFIITAIIVLPFLPNKDYTLEAFPFIYEFLLNYNLVSPDSFSFTVINPYSIWLLVITISFVSFVGYALTKLFGRKGLFLSSFFRGLVSSNGVIMGFSSQTKNKKFNFNLAAFGVIVATGAMLFRAFFDVLFINANMLRYIFLPFIFGILCAGTIAFYLYHKIIKKSEFRLPEVKSPFSMKKLFYLAIVFFVVMVASRFLWIIMGQSGLYIISFASGLLSFNAVNLSLANLAISGEINALAATFSSFLALISNLMFKGILVYFFGEREKYAGFVNILFLGIMFFSAIGFLILKFVFLG